MRVGLKCNYIISTYATEYTGGIKMHSFIRTYPSAASAASSSNISRSAEEDENGSICCDIYIDGEDNSQPQKKGSSSSKPLYVAAVLRGRGSPDLPLPEPEKKQRCSCWVLTLTLVAIVTAAVVIGVSVGEREATYVNKAQRWDGSL
jgi:hypothetical protein